MPLSKLRNIAAIAIVTLVLLGATMACATLRESDEPAPTRRPTLQPTPTTTVIPTPQPFFFGG